MDGHDLIIQLLPAGPLHVSHHVVQLEAFHLFHRVAHSLLAPIAAVLEIWTLCLGLALAAWAAWALVWVLQWPLRVRRSAVAVKVREIS